MSDETSRANLTPAADRWWDEDSYLPWIDAAVQLVFGDTSELHWDLYLQTHAHRTLHGASCSAFPSPPARAPLWRLLADALDRQPRDILETGTALGYTSALLADAFPGAAIDTTEVDAEHAALAQRAFARLGIDRQVRVLDRPRPGRRYDLILVDGGGFCASWAAADGIVIAGPAKTRLHAAAMRALSPLRAGRPPVAAVAEARAAYEDVVAQLIEGRFA